MDIAICQEAGPRRLVANATQLNEAWGSRGRKPWEFRFRSHASSKGINASRAAAFGLGLALAPVFGTSSRAADLIGPVPLQAPSSVAASFDWTGAYFGGHVGYSRGYGRNRLLDPAPTAAGTSFGSLFGGLQFGYNYLLPSRLLVGIEGDISFPNFLDDGIVKSRPTPAGTVTEKLDFVSTVRGRVGYAVDHWLFYATGGLAWSQARFLEDSGLTGNEDKLLRMRAGRALGAGAELAIAPGWTARLEYLYDRLGKASGTFPSGTGYESTTVDLYSLRLGLNRKLDWTGASADPGKVTPAWAIDPNSWSVHGQFTYIEQGYPAFHSPYQGTNSLSGGSQVQNTASATAFVGYRPWDGTEIYVNPELMQGFGLSNTLGVAGFPRRATNRILSEECSSRRPTASSGRWVSRHGLHNAPCSTRVWGREATRGELATQSRSL